jgi:hypothetical protein
VSAIDRAPWLRRAVRRARAGGAVVLGVLALLTACYVLGAPTLPSWVAAVFVLFPLTPVVFAGGPIGAIAGVAASALAWGWLLESLRARRRGALIGAWLVLAAASSAYLAPRLARGTDDHRDTRCDELYAITAERAREVLAGLGGGVPVDGCAARDASAAVSCVVERVERSNPHFFLESGATIGEPRLCRVSLAADGPRALVLTQQPRRDAPLRTTSVRLEPGS